MLTIRQAKPTDCDAMCEVQRASILEHYSRTHGEESARRWAEEVSSEICRERLNSAMVIVAEETGTLLGFAHFEGETGDVEVLATREAEQRAIPGALLAVIETEARTRGIDALRLRAMLNTEKLYVPSGFSVSGAAEPTFAAGSTLPCLKMGKRLHYAEPRPDRRRNGVVHEERH